MLFSYLFTSLLVYFLTYLSTSSTIDPFHFQARGRMRQQKARFGRFSYLGEFYVVVYFVTDVCLLLLYLF